MGSPAVQGKEGEVKRVLVVGCRPGSIGEAVYYAALSSCYEAVFAGLHEEPYEIDVVNDSVADMAMQLGALRPDHIVCTVGINMPEPLAEDPADWYRWHFETNVAGPMRLLKAWDIVLGAISFSEHNHFVAISSNSASVPRSGSAAYCASKAALSMALRVKAREGAAQQASRLVYGYEPGLVRATPMTADTEARFGSGVPLTRMRDPRLSAGISAGALASLVVHNLSLGPEVNGVMFRLDADER